MLKTITLLGSTGSIGTQSLDVCARREYKVGVLAANANVSLLEQQVRKFRPHTAVIADASKYPALKTALADLDTRVLAGPDAVCEVAAADDGADGVVINAIVGIAGLRPTLAALDAGRQVALANKEALITGGALVMDRVRNGKGGIVPIDSEHSAIWQCLNAGDRRDLSGIILTASGGPFLGHNKDKLATVSVEEALRHPNWSMGAKITIDSASMMNKGLEFIEAMWLFGVSPAQIEIVIHRQSVVHSAVEFVDGSVVALLSVPDMRSAIQYALTHPRRMPLDAKKLSLTDYGALTFEKPDCGTFQCLDACITAAARGGLAPCVANGANEQAVALFLNGKISFLKLGELVRAAIDAVKPDTVCTLDSIEDADRAAREFVRSRV
ncbi:MAG: 1-deoxy-D-xylulose-5-phosphate reductoisomerase [Oscillospiraceae bacterium]|nr:1-deoxy-D-xylulose-5-phosphate reductoisomerase [Oscillospiraceae bacterium]